jgi:hypothetical protein
MIGNIGEIDWRNKDIIVYLRWIGVEGRNKLLIPWEFRGVW